MEGYELRPTFLWASKVPETCDEHPHVSFKGAASFIRLLLLQLAAMLGHKQDQRGLEKHPIVLDSESQRLWSRFHAMAERAPQHGPPHSEGVLGKHCFTTTSHIMANHLLCCTFAMLKSSRNDIPRLLAADAPYLAQLTSSPLSPRWFAIPPEAILSAPSHLSHMLYSIITIANEMRLPADQRADTIPSLAPLSRAAPADSTQTPASYRALTAEEAALATLLQRYSHKQHITVTDANAALTAKSGFRSNQVQLRVKFLTQRSGKKRWEDMTPNARRVLGVRVVTLKHFTVRCYLIAHAHSAGPCCGVAGVVVVRGEGVVLWLVLSSSLSLSPVAVAVVEVFFLERPVRILFGAFALLLGPLGIVFGGLGGSQG